MEKQRRGSGVNQYEHHLGKSRKSSNICAGNQFEAVQTGEAGICNVTMKITREMKGKKTATICGEDWKVYPPTTAVVT
jgi:hypothetical protein